MASTHRLFNPRLGLSTAVISLGLACTPTLDFQECRNDLDCTNADGLDLICGEASECMPRPAPSEVPCTVNSECFDLFDQDHVCGPAGACAPLLSDECTEVGRPEGANLDQMVYIGSILATSPPFDATIGPIQNAVVLAIEDFNSRAELPGGKRVGYVACDSAGNVGKAKRAAQSLVAAGVPAIVGPTFSETTLAVASDVTIASDTFLISPTASNKTITDLDDSGLVWRTIGSDVYQAAALADRLSELDPPVDRVLILAKEDAYGSTLSGDVLDRAEDVAPAAYGMLRYPDPATFSNVDQLRAEYGGVIAMGYEHNADTVVLVGTNEVRDLVLFYLTAREAMNPIPPLPRFVVSHGAVPVMTDIVESDAVSPGFRPALMAAIEGVSPIIQNEANFTLYNTRYMFRFLDQEPITASSLGYDATMVTIFAMVAAGEGATGVDIAKGMDRINAAGGDVVAFADPNEFVPGIVAALTDGGSVDVQGVSGELDFDANGEVRTDLIGWGLLPREGQAGVPVLTPVRRYALDAPPAVEGTWMDLAP